jgi:hypothetical protein
MKAYWGSRGMVPCIPRPRHQMEVSGQPPTPPVLSQGKNAWYPLDRRLDGPQSQSGHGSEEKNSQPPPGIEL